MKRILILLFCFNSVFLFSQAVQDSVLIDKIRKDSLKYFKIVHQYKSALHKSMEEHKVFKINFEASNVDDYIYRPYYDSLVSKKLDDSVLLRKSLYYLQKDDIKYFMSMYQDSETFVYYFNGYKDNKLVESFEWNNYTLHKTDWIKKEVYSYSANKKDKNMIYSFSAYKKIVNDKLFDIIYAKDINEDRISKEKNYKKDFPLSREDILRILPQKIKDQAVQLMKGKSFDRYKITWDEKGNLVDVFKLNNEKEIPYNKEDAELAVKLFKIAVKNNDEYFTFEKTYINNEALPVYRIWLKPYILHVDPKTGNILNMEFIRIKE